MKVKASGRINMLKKNGTFLLAITSIRLSGFSSLGSVLVHVLQYSHSIFR